MNVLKRKMFDRTFRDAHGVGITSGLGGRSGYARGGRIGFQGGELVEEDDTITAQFKEKFPNYNVGADPSATLTERIIKGSAELAPEVEDIMSREDYLKQQAGIRDEYLPEQSNRQNWLDLAQFFSRLPGPGGLGENILRAAEETLPAYTERKREEEDLKRAFAVQDIEKYAELKAKHDEQSLASQVAGTEAAISIEKIRSDLNSPDYNIQREAINAMAARIQYESPKFKAEMEDKYKEEYANIPLETMTKEANDLALTWKMLTPTALGNTLDLYGLGEPFNALGYANDYYEDLNKDQSGRDVYDQTPMMNQTQALNRALSRLDLLKRVYAISEEQYNIEKEALLDKFELYTTHNDTEQVNGLFRGMDQDAINDMKNASSTEVDDVTRESLVAEEGHTGQFFDYRDIIEVIDNSYAVTNFKPGMIISLPNGTRIRYLGSNGINEGLKEGQKGYNEKEPHGTALFELAGGSYVAPQEPDPAFEAIVEDQFES